MDEGAIRLKPGRDKPIRRRHPWVFSGAIAHAEDAVDGGIVRIIDHRNRFLARGCWNSQSQIQARVLSWRDEPIDAAWWRRMLSRAIDARAHLLQGERPACRLVNAENDFLPGLIVDRYADWLVLQALTGFVDQRKERIADALAELTGIAKIYERGDLEARSREGLPLEKGALRGGPPPATLEIESDARYLVDIANGQKTGFYLDQRDNRRVFASLVKRQLSRDAGSLRLLNLFCYTGGFAVAAGEFGRVKSVNVDSSYAALELAEANLELNGYRSARHGENAELIQADAFDYLRHCQREGEQFDMVALDPPKFARHKGQLQRAARGYKDLNLQALKVVIPGGLLLSFSCSGAVNRDLFQKIVFGALADSGREAQLLRHFGAASDHPVALSFPEGEYLKGLLLRVY